ncbi:MAG: ASKHA domain-containing protein [Pseudomonadota bacterium]
MIIFQPMGKRIACDKEKSLLELARSAGVGIESACDGKGKCGKCKVQVNGDVTPPGETELSLLSGADKRGLRLACRTKALACLTVWVPEESRLHRQVILTTGSEFEVDLDTSLKVLELDVPAETGPAASADREVLLAALAESAGEDRPTSWTTPLSVLKDLAGILDSGGGKATAVIRSPDTVISLASGPAGPIPGLAVDLGTTTVVAYMLDLRTGKPLAVKAEVNPQIAHGEDVISRIALCAREREGTSLLSGLIRECINMLAGQACSEAGFYQERIVSSVIVGNPTMIEILMGINPQRLGKTPFMPVTYGALELRAADLGLRFAPEAVVGFLPMKAGFFGGDAVAAALALEADRVREPTLIADLGTNGELVLAVPDGLLCCSTAAGPAFEGGHIQWGMRGAPGAVDNVRVSQDDLEPSLSVIGGRQPIGICGSGLVSLIAGLLDAGAIRPDGRFNPVRVGKRLRNGAKTLEYVLAFKQSTGTGQDLVLTSKDVSELQLAKAAVYAGASIMMDDAGVKSLSRVLLAGAFGNYLNDADACRIGMFPGVTDAAVQGVGNAAGAGAVIALLNRSKRERAEEIAARMRHFDLARDRRFGAAYAAGLRFP